MTEVPIIIIIIIIIIIVVINESNLIKVELASPNIVLAFDFMHSAEETVHFVNKQKPKAMGKL